MGELISKLRTIATEMGLRKNMPDTSDEETSEVVIYKTNKQVVTWCISITKIADELVNNRQQFLKEAKEIVKSEEELEGEMPDSIFNKCTSKEILARMLQETVRLTKLNIIQALEKAFERES